MSFGAIIKIAWEGIVANKVRSLLTMLGVIIGVAAVIVMIAVSAGTEATIADQINSLGANLIFVQASFGRGMMGGGGATPSLTYDDALAMTELSGVSSIAVEQFSSQTVKAGNVTLEGVEILGTTPDFPSVRDMEIASGRFFKEEEIARTTKVAVLGSGLAEELFGDGQTPSGRSSLSARSSSPSSVCWRNGAWWATRISTPASTHPSPSSSST